MSLIQTQIDFREGMSRMGASVNLIATDGEGGKHGLVASAVCSVTDSPPTVLVCINKSAFTHDKFLQNGVLCINVLAGHHQELSGVFARYVEGVDRFAHGDWTTLETGSPVLEDANAALDCAITSVEVQGSHSVLFCQVHAVKVADDTNSGLIYFSRDYHQLEAAVS